MKGEQLKGTYRVLRSLHLSYNGTAYRVSIGGSKSHMVFVFLADKRENIYRRRAPGAREYTISYMPE
jgi:hypothetical protein